MKKNNSNFKNNKNKKFSLNLWDFNQKDKNKKNFPFEANNKNKNKIHKSNSLVYNNNFNNKNYQFFQ